MRAKPRRFCVGRFAPLVAALLPDRVTPEFTLSYAGAFPL
jgi:hypothetical protein